MVTGLILRNVTHSNEWAAVTGNLSVDISAIMQTLQRFYSGSLTAVVLGLGFLQTKRRSGSISFLSVSPFAMREKKKGVVTARRPKGLLTATNAGNTCK